MVTASFARIQPEKEARLRDWLTEPSTRKDEVRRSLAQEGTRHAQVYLLPPTDEPVLVYAMEAEDVKRAYAALGASSLPIDEEHRALLAEVLAEPLQIEALYDCSVA